MQIKDLHLVICVLVHFVKSWSRRCAVTRDTIRGHPSLETTESPLSIVIATMIHNDGPRDSVIVVHLQLPPLDTMYRIPQSRVCVRVCA
ncbi:hypothetical protein ALC56_00125 [Trachymyrmex septentrionalis]|uniref:Secreted protein n=1 Tax=Trachymyrmex septentrionalis TaxID=34720 RepID=A0A195FYC3_9HYME|nr:hypothetical protein ALC56_00125 [Trachymyrmex septentrionalis]